MNACSEGSHVVCIFLLQCIFDCNHTVCIYIQKLTLFIRFRLPKIIMTTFLFKRLSFLRQSINLSHLYLCYCVLEIIVLKTQKYSRIRHRRFNYKVERRQKNAREICRARVQSRHQAILNLLVRSPTFSVLATCNIFS